MEQTRVDFSVDAHWIVPVENNKNEIFFKKFGVHNEEEAKFLCGYTIGVKEGKIHAILPTEIFYKHFETENRYDFSTKDTVLIPGLINCHTHIGMTIFRGCVDDVSLYSFLNDYIWPAEAQFVSEDFVKLSAELAAYEFLKNGTTMVNDMYFYHDISEKVCEDANLRIITGQTLMAHNEKFVKELPYNMKRAISEMENFDESKHPLRRKSFTPHSLYTLDKKYHKELIEANKKFNNVYHVHLNESQEEVESYKKNHSKSPASDLYEIGGLTSNVIGAHCVWLNDDEIKKFAENNASVCHCPRSNLKLGSGICNIKKYIDNGVNVCVGTDSSCTNNFLDVLSEVKLACLLSKGSREDSTSISAFEALKMATINGAKALNRSHDLGSLEVGKLCDMVLIDLSATTMIPIYDPISHLIYTKDQQVVNVWIGGRLVVEDSKVLTVKPNVSQIKEISNQINDFICSRRKKKELKEK